MTEESKEPVIDDEDDVRVALCTIWLVLGVSAMKSDELAPMDARTSRLS